MLERINSYIWNAGLLVLLLGTGTFLSIKTGFFQIRRAGFIFRSIKASLKQNGSSQWKISASALAAAMGTGNIVGVTAALAIGGPGAIFWMEISAFLGMMLTYGENVLAMRFRRRDKDGNALGGPMAYLRYGLGSRSLAAVYAVLCIFASLGMGNMTQSSAAANALSGSFGISPLFIGVCIGAFLLLTVIGGVKSIGSAVQFLLPLAAAGYMLTAFAVILVNYRNIPDAIGRIFTGAFGIRQAGAGAIGSAVSAGLRHGVFSNEAGLGSSALIHSNSDDNDRYLQGMWSIAEVFLDTVVCCTLTALMVLTSGVPIEMGAGPVAEAFSIVLGDWGSTGAAVMIALFAVCTMLGWCCCGEMAVRSLCSRKIAVSAYRVIFCICGIIGSMGALSDIWTLSDIANGLMAIPNLLALILLSRYITLPERQDRVQKCGK
ncbi:MAG: amino acid carrier protein [Oscillospiraceae bacterium]|nr:amino acid carrier protein [Oscillospiraceae bacterium]